jgi:hypothetical protein
VQADNTFNQAADAFSGLVSRIPDDVLRQPGLGEWDVRSLIGHTARESGSPRRHAKDTRQNNLGF